jgi:hypothetical protein
MFGFRCSLRLVLNHSLKLNETTEPVNVIKMNARHPMDQ